MGEILSVVEINNRYHSEWVLLGNPETDGNLNIQCGTLLRHSKNRDELYRKARELSPVHSAILYTGQLPSTTAVIL